MSSPSRLQSTEAHIRIHIAPYFDALVDDVSQVNREMVRQFIHHLAGHDLEPPEDTTGARLVAARTYGVSEAAEACDVHPSTIKRALKSGALPGHTRKVVGGRTVAGSIRIPAGDLLEAGFTLHGKRSDTVARKGLSKKYASQILNTLRNGLTIARAEGFITHDPTENLTASTPRPAVANKKPNRERVRAITLEETKGVAGLLSIHHQVVLWLQRLLGLRISEAFGLRNSDIADFGDVGLAVIHRQGGRLFSERDDYGNIRTSPVREVPKTSAGYRSIGVADPLLELLRVYVEAFHRHPGTGDVDPDARLVLGPRDPNTGGQQSYHEALKAALARRGLNHDTLGFHVTSQSMRKSLSVELHAYVDVSELTRSRYLGHRLTAHDGGAEMTAAAYTPDMLDIQPFLAAGRGIGALVRREIGDLFIEPGAQPNPARGSHDPNRSAHVRDVLRSAGWVDTADGVELDAAAAQLGISAHRLQDGIRQGEISAVDSLGPAGERVTVLTDDELERLANTQSPPRGHQVSVDAVTIAGLDNTPNTAGSHQLPADAVTIADLAEKLGLNYSTVYQWTTSGRITAWHHPGSRLLVVDPADVEREIAEVARVAALRERSMTVAEAAERIECGHSIVYHWLRKGELQRDHETDQNGLTYVERESVETKAAQQRAKLQDRTDRRPVPDDLVPLAEVQRRTGHTRHQIAALVDAGVLIRHDHDRRYHIERASLDAYQSSRRFR